MARLNFQKVGELFSKKEEKCIIESGLCILHEDASGSFEGLARNGEEHPTLRYVFTSAVER
jgi:hypothetical protein